MPTDIYLQTFIWNIHFLFLDLLKNIQVSITRIFVLDLFSHLLFQTFLNTRKLGQA